MGWRSTFRIGHVIVDVQSDTDICRDEMQAIISLYEPDSSASPNLSFAFEQTGNGFSLNLNGQNLWQSAEPLDFPPALEIHLYGHVVDLLPPKLLSLHASCLSNEHGALIFAGDSGSGKSSLCTAALLDGAGYLSDEFTLLGEDGRITPFPRPLQWERIDHPAFTPQQLLDSRLFTKQQFSFPDPDGNTITSHLWLPANVQREAVRATYIFLPAYDADARPAELTPIRRGEGLMLLARLLHHPTLPSEAIRELNRRIPDDTLFFSLRFSDVHAAWQTVKRSACD